MRCPSDSALGAEHGILTQAWSPIGGITFYRDGVAQQHRAGPVIARLAEAHNKTPAQVMLMLASAAEPLGDPEVDQPAADR